MYILGETVPVKAWYVCVVALNLRPIPNGGVMTQMVASSCAHVDCEVMMVASLCAHVDCQREVKMVAMSRAHVECQCKVKMVASLCAHVDCQREVRMVASSRAHVNCQCEVKMVALSLCARVESEAMKSMMCKCVDFLVMILLYAHVDCEVMMVLRAEGSRWNLMVGCSTVEVGLMVLTDSDVHSEVPCLHLSPHRCLHRWWVHCGERQTKCIEQPRI